MTDQTGDFDAFAARVLDQITGAAGTPTLTDDSLSALASEAWRRSVDGPTADAMRVLFEDIGRHLWEEMDKL